MSAGNVCRVCLTSNLNLHCVRNELQNAYEKITGRKYNKAGYPVSMCYICLSMLQKCQRFMETAQHSDHALEQWYNDNEIKLANPLYIYSVTKLDSVTLEDEVNLLQKDIKVEEVDLGLDYIENTGMDVEKTNPHEEAVNYEVPIEFHSVNDEYDPIKDNINTHTDNKRVGYASNVDIHTNIKTEVEIIQSYDEAPATKKRKSNETYQYQAPETSGESSSNSQSSDDNKVQKLPTETQKMNPIEKRNPYACKICGLRFTQQFNLDCHIRTHDGEKPFPCNVCNFSCTRKSNLTAHMMTHTGEKPFACETCNLKFTTFSHMKRHLLSVKHLNKF